MCACGCYLNFGVFVSTCWYLDQKLTGSDAWLELTLQCHAALKFVIQHNLDKDGFSWSSWQQHGLRRQWHLWAFKYSADQETCISACRAAAELYHSSEYARDRPLS